ncbi:MAG: glycosyltransferase [bacterium]|nr:glycosyltransferase [bacterium]
MPQKASPGKTPVAFVSDYLPRRCGIATFTYDLAEAMATVGGDDYDIFTVAVNDRPEGYPYSDRVRFEIRETVQADYRLAADFLNVHQVSAVCLQHEYGIFGGKYGSHILALLRRLRRPLVTTHHTILKDPDDQQLMIMQEIGQLADRMVVMSELAHEFLHDIYKVPKEKIVTIPHGIHDVPFIDPSFYKDKFGVEGRKVMFTFGLLSPGKGLEFAIEALPQIVKQHPDLAYIVLGATHPHIKKESGEEYRNGLLRRASELGVKDNLIMVNRFVELEELCEYLGSADIYVTPYLNEAQITSGTLAYALGAGKATVSTPYWHAKELLADRRGRLVPFKDADAIAKDVIDLLNNSTERDSMRKRAYTYCRDMVWAKTAQAYLDLFKEASEASVANRHVIQAAVKPAKSGSDELPEIDLRHMRIMTDDTGILQHSRYSTPDRFHGYCTDDNARALIAASMYWDLRHDESAIELIQKYLGFLAYAMDNKTNRFKNFMNYDRSWAETCGSEDSHARALWGLGMAVAYCPHESIISLATKLFVQGLSVTEKFCSPRAWAFTIVGIQAYLRRYGGDSEVRRCRAALAEKIVALFETNADEDWPWCENVVTYANAKLPHALMMCGKWMGRDDWIDISKRALQWLLDIQTNENGMLSVIGSNGWYVRGGEKAQFDQQAIEAHALIDACVEAYHITREPHWLEGAKKAFNWFLGDNDLRTPVYDFTTSGCRDGLHPDRVNENQGAESTLAWLLSLLMMHDLEMEQTLGSPPSDKDENISQARPVAKAIKPAGPVGIAKDKTAPKKSKK